MYVIFVFEDDAEDDANTGSSTCMLLDVDRGVVVTSAQLTLLDARSMVSQGRANRAWICPFLKCPSGSNHLDHVFPSHPQ